MTLSRRPDAPKGLSLTAESLRALVQPTDASLVAIDGGTLVVNGFDVRRDAARVRRSIGLAGQYLAVEGDLLAATGRAPDFSLPSGTPEEAGAPNFTYDGIMRSVEESFQRTGLNRFDVPLLHDPDDHFDAASTSGYRALAKLREEGTVRAIGAGMNQAPMLARLVEACDLDVLLVAGRYTLLDQVAMDELLPLCEQRTVSIVVGGVFNSGILIDPAPGTRYNYVPAEADVIARAQQIKAVCDRHDVPLPAAALQFPLAHPRVCTVLLGIRTIDELEKDVRWLDVPIPDELWAELKHEGLLREDAPTPSSAKIESTGQ